MKFLLAFSCCRIVLLIDSLRPFLFCMCVYVCLCVCAGTGAAILFSALCSFASEYLPAPYMQAIILGKGMCGLIVAAVRIITKAALPQDPFGTDGVATCLRCCCCCCCCCCFYLFVVAVCCCRRCRCCRRRCCFCAARLRLSAYVLPLFCYPGLRTSTYIFFACGMLNMLICMAAYFVLIRLPYVKFHMEAASYKSLVELAPTLPSSLSAVSELESEQPPVSELHSEHPPHVAPVLAIAEADPEDFLPAHKSNRSADGTNHTAAAPAGGKEILSVLRKVWPNGLQVFTVFLVTLCLFPGVVTEIRPLTPGLPNDWFVISLIVRLFAICVALFDFQ